MLVNFQGTVRWRFPCPGVEALTTADCSMGRSARNA